MKEPAPVPGLSTTLCFHNDTKDIIDNFFRQNKKSYLTAHTYTHTHTHTHIKYVDIVVSTSVFRSGFSILGLKVQNVEDRGKICDKTYWNLLV